MSRQRKRRRYLSSVALVVITLTGIFGAGCAVEVRNKCNTAIHNPHLSGGTVTAKIDTQCWDPPVEVVMEMSIQRKMDGNWVSQTTHFIKSSTWNPGGEYSWKKRSIFSTNTCVPGEYRARGRASRLVAEPGDSGGSSAWVTSQSWTTRC